MTNDKQQIRKYANRKLYHVGRASYVSMLELSDVVADGVAVEVVEDVTGRDVTLEVLTRALYERVKDRQPSEGDPKPRDVARLIARVTRRSQE
jgi:polyhydroxyalkanoate synthesis regulator protein